MVRASAKAVRVPARKMNVVASLVRGRQVDDAITILEHTPRKAAKPLKKLIESARANAEDQGKLDQKSLTIDTINVGPGIAMKRYRPTAHGRALPYKRQTSNIEVKLTGKEKVKKSSAKKKTNNKQTSKEKA